MANIIGSAATNRSPTISADITEAMTDAASQEQKKLIEARMEEYARKREERLREQRERKQQIFSELTKEQKKLSHLREKWEQEELKKAKTLAKKQLMEIQDIQNRKKKNQEFSENIKERAAKAKETVEAFEAKEAIKRAEFEKEKQRRKEKKIEDEKKWKEYEKRVQQRRLSPSH